MGQQQSALSKCLTVAVGNDASLVAQPLFKGDPKFFLADVKPYNLDVPTVIPTAVVYPKTNEHVADIVKCASAGDTKVQARNGGHSYANYCLGGEDGHIVIDLKNMKFFAYDEDSQHATFGAGTLLAEVTEQLLEHDRAIAHGTCPQVGLSGHAGIGGLGPSSRMWGSTLDHVLAATVILADGSIVRASEDENEDVFFAIKGAAAGFGVVTALEMLTRKAPGMAVRYNYAYNWGDKDQLADAFIAWQDLITSDTVTKEHRFASQFIVLPIGAIVSGTFFGSQEDFEKLDLKSVFPIAANDFIVEFEDFGGLVANWAEEVALEAAGGIPAPFYSQSLPFTKGNNIPEEGVSNLFDFVDENKKDSPIFFLIFDLEGGVINEVPQNATAYAHRDAVFYAQSYGIGFPGATSVMKRFISGMTDAIKDSMSDVEFGSYPGYVDMALGDRQQELYWGSNLPRLMDIKKNKDPKDVFHNPGSVRPGS